MPDLGIKVLRTGHFFDFPHHFMAREAPHDCLLIWVTAGAGWARTEGHDLRARAGTLLTFLPDEAHAYGSDHDRPWDIVWMHFEGPQAATWVRELRHIGGGLAPLLGQSERLRHRFIELVETYGSRTDESRELITPLGVAVLGLIRHQMRLPSGSAVERAQMIDRIRAYVRDHLAESITNDDIAHHVHVSRRQLTRLMRQALGQAPMDYVIRQRLGRAATLLAETTFSVQHIAGLVGYTDPAYFSRLFHRRMKVSPTAYRHRRS